MTQERATVDGDQLAVLRRLRERLGPRQVEVLEVAHELPPGRSPAPGPDLAPTPDPVRHHQHALGEEEPPDLLEAFAEQG